MPNPWFRMYSEFRSDPKVCTMTDSLQIRLVRLMCLRSDSPTENLDEEEICYGIGCNDSETFRETKRVFVSKGFIDENWRLLNWEKRQFISDSSTERVRKFRENKALKRSETFRETVGETNQNRTDAEQSRTEQNKSMSSSGSEWRILCESLGVFDVKEQQAIHQLLDARVRHSGKTIDESVEYIISRWQEYQKACPKLEYTHGSAYKFLMSGKWDNPSSWPWKKESDLSSEDWLAGYDKRKKEREERREKENKK